MIIRRHITSNFTIIPNEAILDSRLSISARWLLAYLLSRPNDWQVQVGDIQKKGGIGREKAYRLIKELITVGWVRKDFSRGDGGQWGGIDYVVMDQPEVEEISVSPCAENPYTVKPHTENHHLTKNLKKPRTEKVTNTKNNISSDTDFEEFWAAYPKRPNNPKKPAKLKYTAARKRGVSHDLIMAGVNEYAKTRINEDPKFTKLAETWLNKECWEADYSVYGGKPSLKTEAGEKWLDEIVAVYPGHVGDRAEAAKLIAVELSKGVQGKDLWDAARKYKLFCKGPPYEDRKITPAMLETWLKFKWREMDGYEFCTVGPDRIRTVRPKKVAA
jgi:hypothetical protein